MKLAKLGFLVFLLSMMMVACGDDSTTDPDGDPVTPTTKITITTLIDGSEVDRKVVEGKDGVFTPSDYQLNGYYTNVNGLFSMQVFGEINSQTNLTVTLIAILSELKAGTYTFGANDDQNFGNYTNTNFGDDQYSSTSTSLVITKVQYIGITENVGSYYITGTLSMDLENEYNENPNVTVNVTFQDMPISKSITGF
jgi:hypothetical protein